jgi:hypothetical protein
MLHGTYGPLGLAVEATPASPISTYITPERAAKRCRRCRVYTSTVNKVRGQVIALHNWPELLPRCFFLAQVLSREPGSTIAVMPCLSHPMCRRRVRTDLSSRTGSGSGSRSSLSALVTKVESSSCPGTTKTSISRPLGNWLTSI